jgi:RNA polymerase sigma-70 factor (ECF subfamily)
MCIIVLSAILDRIQRRGDGPMTALMMDEAHHLTLPTDDACDASDVMSASAFEAEIRTHQRSLYQWACRLTRDPDAAYDLVQDTLERGYRKRSLFQPGTNVRAWLLHIMRNVWISRHRRAETKTQMMSLDDLDDLTLYRRATHGGRRVTTVEACVVDHLSEASILEAIEILAPRYREVVLLADVDGFGYQDIAERLQIPMGSVASRLFRARRLLRIALREQAHAAGYQTRAS